VKSKELGKSNIKASLSTITTNIMIDVHMSSMDMVSFVGVPPLGEAESQCKGRATFWLDSLMENEEFICTVVVNATLWFANSLHA
jgi:hypothetical protein